MPLSPDELVWSIVGAVTAATCLCSIFMAISGFICVAIEARTAGLVLTLAGATVFFALLLTGIVCGWIGALASGLENRKQQREACAMGDL